MLKFHLHKKEEHLRFNYIPRYYSKEGEEVKLPRSHDAESVKERIQHRFQSRQKTGVNLFNTMVKNRKLFSFLLTLAIGLGFYYWLQLKEGL